MLLGAKNAVGNYSAMEIVNQFLSGIVYWQNNLAKKYLPDTVFFTLLYFAALIFKWHNCDFIVSSQLISIILLVSFECLSAKSFLTKNAEPVV